jgi:hypothetical protein
MRPITRNAPKSTNITAKALIKTVTARLVGGVPSSLTPLDCAGEALEVGVGVLMMVMDCYE